MSRHRGAGPSWRERSRLGRRAEPRHVQRGTRAGWAGRQVGRAETTRRARRPTGGARHRKQASLSRDHLCLWEHHTADSVDGGHPGRHGAQPWWMEPRGPVPQAPQASPTSGPVATTQRHGGGTAPAKHPVSTQDKCGPPHTTGGTQKGSNRRPEPRAAVAGGVPRGRRAHESAGELLPWETGNAARKTRAHHPRHEWITQETARAALSEAPRGAPCSCRGQGGSGRPEGTEAQGGPRRAGGWQREGLGTDRLRSGSGHGWTHRPLSGWRAPPWPWAGCFLARFQWRPGRWLSHLKQ